MDGGETVLGSWREVFTSKAGTRASHWWGLGAVLLFLLLLNLGTRGLNEPDETRYSNIARAMLGPRGDWWIPRMSGFGHFDKPPLVYWCTALSLRAFGGHEAAARLPSLMGALMTLAGISWVAWRIYGARAAWWTVLFCGTLGQFFVLSRMLTPDMLLTGFSTLAAGFWAEERHRGARGTWWWGFALLASLAWWTKATAALVPLLGLLIGTRATGDRDGWRALRPLRLICVVLAVGAPWYADLMMHQPELRDFFLGRELAGRIVGHPDGRKGPIYYHVGFSLVGWLPWWPVALIAAFQGRRDLWQQLKDHRWRAVPLEGWMVLTGLGVFSLLSSKLVTYTLPYAPWAALWSVRALLGVPIREIGLPRLRAVFRMAAAFLVLYGAAGFILPTIETRLGLGSSVRKAGWFLKEHQCNTVFCDRYLPGFEYYFGEHVFYVKDEPPRQVPSDSGICPGLGESHFMTPAEADRRLHANDGGDVWLVRYKGKNSSPLTRSLADLECVEEVKLGDFVLDRVAIHH